ncbi:unnamed protein product [Didymodactylos carnosus]|uniref:Fucosyltransferase n=1 Tax=Didymodactylos carnosus TaxID=1234261 RepID=A0A8S2DAE1_9BILA|nr:unnamed protein product [Didymodactylos carnosus]CAF3693850.1 unnamed protein product [Didymodactylos carnosus]
MFWPKNNFDSDKIWINNCSVPCSVTYDRRRAFKTDIVLVHQTKSIVEGFINRQSQKLALLSLEPFCMYDIAKNLAHVDILISFHKFSDVQVTYSNAVVDSFKATENMYYHLNKRFNILNRFPNMTIKDQRVLGAFFISQCRSKDRLRYLKELMTYIPLDSYGKCLHSKHIDRRTYDKRQTFAKYKFAISFENSILPDYVTEKYWQALTSDAIGVYWGAPNIRDYYPKQQNKIMIEVKNYPDPKDLANYLLMLHYNNTAYLEYFQWRYQQLDETFNRMNINGFDNGEQHSWICKTCENYHNRFQ